MGDRLSERTEADETGAEAAALLPPPRDFHLSPEHKPLKSRAITLQLTTCLYVLFHAGSIALMLYNLWFVSSYLNNEFQSQEEFMAAGELIDFVGGNVNTVWIGILVVCVIAYSLFVYRAASNIQKSNAKGLSDSPAWAVGWSFIPFANLFGIFNVMKCIWIASHDPRRGAIGMPVLLPLWWTAYLGGNIASNIASRFAEGAMMSLDIEVIRGFTWLTVALSGVSALAGILLILIVRGVTRAQDRWPEIAAQQPAVSSAPASSVLGF